MSSEGALRTKTEIATFIQIISLICLFLGVVFWSEDGKVLLRFHVNFIGLSYLVEFCRRLRLFLEELFYLKSRYRNNFISLICDAFYFKSKTIILFLLHVIIYIILLYFNEEPRNVFLSSFGLHSVIIFCCLSALPFLQLEVCPLSTSHSIKDFFGLDYGSGMAYSYFYGYLKIVLPRTGGQDKSFREFIDLYESKEGVQFEVKKLFILLPMSCQCHSTLKNEYSPNVDEAKPLDELLKDVGGVKKRSYKNSVYKIKHPRTDKRVYASVEYATPLLTFQKVISQNTMHSKIYEKYKNDIVLQFYLTLKQILQENPDCGDLCELIYYNDLNTKGNFVNVGNIVLKRIKEIKDDLKMKKD